MEINKFPGGFSEWKFINRLTGMEIVPSTQTIAHDLSDFTSAQ